MTAIAFVSGKVKAVENKRVGGQDMAELTLEVKAYGDKVMYIDVACWGPHRNVVLDTITKGSTVEVTAEPVTDDWPINKDVPDGPKNSKIGLRLREQSEAEMANPDHVHKVVKAEADRQINEVHFNGTVSYLGENEPFGKTTIRRAFVSVKLPKKDGTLSNWSYPVRLRGGFGEKATPDKVGKDTLVQVVAAIENDTWKDKDGTTNRYEGRFVVAGKGHSFAKAG